MENILVTSALEKAKKAVKDLGEKTYKKTQNNLVHYANETESVIRERLEQLEKEWDIERAIVLESSALTIAGVVLGSMVNKKWYLLSGIAGIFLGLRALTGWCPPSAIMKGSGVRSRKEIDKEKYGLMEILKLRKQNKL